jgi:hypothetical protein
MVKERVMFKRVGRFGKWVAILYVIQALIGTAVGTYVYWSGSSVFGIGLTP